MIARASWRLGNRCCVMFDRYWYRLSRNAPAFTRRRLRELKARQARLRKRR